jgi:hypothetical protein
MKIGLNLCSLVLILMCLLGANETIAHQQKESYTTVLLNQRSGLIEIAHRFYIHDAEHAIAKVTGKTTDLTAEQSAKDDFALYVSRTFQLKYSQADNLLALQTVGFEIEGKYFWLYQQAPMPNELNALHVKMTSLQEVWPSQINHINLEKGKAINSVRLSSEDEWKLLTLNHKSNINAKSKSHSN